MLDYATQVSELEKIARLSPRPVVARPPPALVESAGACLVCGARPARACAACRAVSYCGAEHQRKDARWHDAVCGALASVAEDEAADPAESLRELFARSARHADVRSLNGWDDYLGPGAARSLTDLATRPLTLASMIASLDVRARAVHVVAATHRETEVPLAVWNEAARLLGGELDLSFIGPEVPDRAGIKTRRALYEPGLWTSLGRPDLIIGFDCGLLMYPTWKRTLVSLRGCGVPFVVTTFRDWEAAGEARVLPSLGLVCVRPPRANPWATRVAKRSSTIANDVSYDNAFVSVWE